MRHQHQRETWQRSGERIGDRPTPPDDLHPEPGKRCSRYTPERSALRRPPLRARLDRRAPWQQHRSQKEDGAGADPLRIPTVVQRSRPRANRAQYGGSGSQAASQWSPSSAIVSGGTRVPHRAMIWFTAWTAACSWPLRNSAGFQEARNRRSPVQPSPPARRAMPESERRSRCPRASGR